MLTAVGQQGGEYGVTRHDDLDDPELYWQERIELDYPPVVLGEGGSGCEPPSSLGSAKALTGRQLTVVAFVDVGGAPWEARQKREMLRAVQVAQRFLEGEARRHHAALSFETEVIQERDLSITEAQATALSHDQIGETALLELTDQITAPWQRSASPSDWVTRFKRQHGVDGAHLIVMLNRPGRAYARFWISGSKQWLDPSVVYLEDPRAPMLESGTIAHEILHNYNAQDLYYESAASELLGTLSLGARDEIKARWPEAIMLQSGYGGEHINKYVSPLTAWAVGWGVCGDLAFYRRMLREKQARF